MDIASLPEEAQTYIRQLRSEAAENRVAAREWEAKFNTASVERDQLNTKVTGYESELTTLRESSKTNDLKSWRTEAAEKHKIPASVAALLSGDSKEDILAAAEAVAKDLPGAPAGRRVPPTDTTVREPEGGRGTGTGSREDRARALGDQLRQMRGLPVSEE